MDSRLRGNDTVGANPCVRPFQRTQGALAAGEGRHPVHLQQIKEQIEQAGVEVEQAERRADLERAAQLRYGTQVELENQLKEKEAKLAKLQKEQKMLKEEVGEEDIAEVISRCPSRCSTAPLWTATLSWWIRMGTILRFAKQ